MLAPILDSSVFQIGFVLVLVAFVFFGFIREKIPPDVVALLAMGALMLTGILTVGETISVFANAAPITVAASTGLRHQRVSVAGKPAAGSLIHRWVPGKLRSCVAPLGPCTLRV